MTLPLENPRVINPEGGISARDTSTGRDVYLKPGSMLHTIAASGVLGSVSPYVPPPLPEEPPKYPTLIDAQAAVADLLSEAVSPLMSGVPAAESLSWGTKAVAASRYLEGSASPEEIAMLDGESALTGETSSDLAVHISTRAAAYRAISAAVAGLRRKVSSELDAESDPNAWESIVAGVPSRAQAHLATLGVSDLLGGSQ